MKLLLSSIVLVTLTVCAQSSVENESNIRVLTSAKGYKTLKSGKSVKVQKSMKYEKVGKASNSESGPSISSTYIYHIVKAMLDLNEPTGSSLSAIEKNIKASLPSTKKWGNTTFLTALKSMVTAGDLLEVKDDSGRSTYIYLGVGKAPSMSSTYIYLIVKAILDLNEPTGSSLSAIEKNVQASLPSTMKWGNTTFLTALKSMVTAGDLQEVKDDSGRSTYIYRH